MAIGEKAMLIHLHIREWTARKYDKAVSNKVKDDYQAKKDAGRYNKQLIAKEKIKEIRRIVLAIRTYNDENTLPWDDNGVRMLPAANYLDYVKEMNRFKSEFEIEVREFLQIYPDIIDAEAQRLGDMFNKDDYPDMATIEKKYSFTTKIVPVPNGDDFRVTLNEDEVSSIKDEITKKVAQSTKVAMQDLWKRLFKVVEHMIDRLSDKTNKFNDSVVGNIESLCDILPKLNVTNDSQLAQSVNDIKNELTKYEPQALRDDKEIRNKTADAAQKILNKMKSYQ